MTEILVQWKDAYALLQPRQTHYNYYKCISFLKKTILHHIKENWKEALNMIKNGNKIKI